MVRYLQHLLSLSMVTLPPCKIHLLENLANIFFSIVGVQLYGKPYFLGNAGYAFSYLQEATTKTNTHIFIHPKALPHPLTTTHTSRMEILSSSGFHMCLARL